MPSEHPIHCRSHETRLMPLGLDGLEECTVLTPGQSRSSFAPTYWLYQPRTGNLLRRDYDAEEMNRGIMEAIECAFAKPPYPFSFPTLRHFAGFLSGPHMLQVLNEKIAVTSDRAGANHYWMDLETGCLTPAFHPDTYVEMLYASTVAVDAATSSIYSARWLTADSGKPGTVECEVVRAVLDGEESTVARVTGGNFIHQVGLTRDHKHLVLAQMGMFVEGDPEEARIRRQADACRLAPSQLTVIERASGDWFQADPPVACPAHVEFDPKDPHLLYVSCHNMGLHACSNILFGPGALARYRICGGRLIREGVFTCANFYRITSHKLVRLWGRDLIAVTVYPNRLQLIDAATMESRGQYIVYAAAPEPPEVLRGLRTNLDAPFSLINLPGTQALLLSSTRNFYVMDFSAGMEGPLVTTIPYNETGEFLVGGHISTAFLQ